MVSLLSLVVFMDPSCRTQSNTSGDWWHKNSLEVIVVKLLDGLVFHSSFNDSMNRLRYWSTKPLHLPSSNQLWCSQLDSSVLSCSFSLVFSSESSDRNKFLRGKRCCNKQLMISVSSAEVIDSNDVQEIESINFPQLFSISSVKVSDSWGLAIEGGPYLTSVPFNITRPRRSLNRSVWPIPASLNSKVCKIPRSDSWQKGVVPNNETPWI